VAHPPQKGVALKRRESNRSGRQSQRFCRKTDEEKNRKVEHQCP
jgi:hypothetical protein